MLSLLLGLFGRNSIYKSVMVVIKERIQLAQREHDEHVKQLKAEQKLEIKRLKERLKIQKQENARQLVESIVGKIL